MQVNIENLLPSIPSTKISEDFNLPSGIFRFSLSDFVAVWRGFPNHNLIEKRERLERIFNTDYFDAHIVVSDAISLDKMVYSTFSAPSPQDRSGFIYIYTFEDNVLAGKYSQGWLWWTAHRYKAKLKIGRTEQNVFNRIDQQLATRTSVSEPPILLAAFWTNSVIQCERDIHLALGDKRLTDNTGRAAKGGVEWFKDTPTMALPTVIEWVTYHRNNQSNSIEQANLDLNGLSI
jgi:Meiotically up-regulated gene 113